METTFITDLPPELFLKIVEYLPLSAVGQISQTCTKFRYLCKDDSIWQVLCLRVCNSQKLDEFEAAFYDIYTKVFHRFQRCIGLWRRKLKPYGGLIEVKVENGVLLGIEYNPLQSLGKFRLREIFSIGINRTTNETDILCLDRLGHRRHAGSITFGNQDQCIGGDESPLESNEMRFECSFPGHILTYHRMVDTICNEDDRWRKNVDHQRRLCIYEMSPINMQSPDPCCPIQPGFFTISYGRREGVIVALKYDLKTYEPHIIVIMGNPNYPSGNISRIVRNGEGLNPEEIAEERYEFWSLFTEMKEQDRELSCAISKFEDFKVVSESRFSYREVNGHRREYWSFHRVDLTDIVSHVSLSWENEI